jgi:hypothetical protein
MLSPQRLVTKLKACSNGDTDDHTYYQSPIGESTEESVRERGPGPFPNGTWAGRIAARFKAGNRSFHTKGPLRWLLPRAA